MAEDRYGHYGLLLLCKERIISISQDKAISGQIATKQAFFSFKYPQRWQGTY